MKTRKIKRVSYGFYLTPQQLSLIKDWIEYNQSIGVSKYSADYVLDIFSEYVKADEGFNQYLQTKEEK